ncbi:MAG TPA: S53 family peptidase [Gaiellaceae bacterium]|nr:S53 family peptidase [Gaiellaceae bacterium]
MSEFQQLGTSETPPTEAQCFAANPPAGRRCFTPQSIRAAYNVGPLYARGFDGRGQTIAIVDSYGSDTMAADLKVFDDAFGLPHLCGEPGVACTPGMAKFSELSLQGSPETKPQGGSGTGLEDKTGWAIEVALDVEWAHAIAPGANILLVHTPTAETLGVQGFPQMMMAEDYVVKHGLAQVISQSLASAEDAFGSPQSLLNLRYAFEDAKDAGVTVLGSSGDSGTANVTKQALVGNGTGGPTGGLIPTPSVVWPASDPLVTGVGGTNLCSDPLNTSSRVLDAADPPTTCRGQGEIEIGWIGSGGGFSHVFGRPSFQDALPAGSTAIPADARGVPDVAYDASARTGVLVYVTLPPAGLGGLPCPGGPCSTGWYVVGGTSAGSPQWAGLIAIADQLNGGGLGWINPALYEIGADPARYAADFFDVTTGNNTQPGTGIPGYPATTGWDPVTGLGTPNAAVFLPDLVAAVNGH